MRWGSRSHPAFSPHGSVLGYVKDAKVDEFFGFISYTRVFFRVSLGPVIRSGSNFTWFNYKAEMSVSPTGLQQSWHAPLPDLKHSHCCAGRLF
jgi:hypothetical protein